MCSVVFLYRPGADWPLIMAANRDEMADRPSREPGRHWPEFPHVTAGMDELAGGSWLGLNDEGVVAAIMNRRGTLGPQAGKRSRGELVLEALGHADAADAADNMAHLAGQAYRPFNMVIADNRDAFVLHHRGDDFIEVQKMQPGLWMLCAGEVNDPQSPRIVYNLPRFEKAAAPDPDKGDFSAWQNLLLSREHDAGADAYGAMYVTTDSPFGTVSSALLALSSPETGGRAVWRFCPAGGAWRAVTLDHAG